MLLCCRHGENLCKFSLVIPFQLSVISLIKKVVFYVDFASGPEGPWSREVVNILQYE